MDYDGPMLPFHFSVYYEHPVTTDKMLLLEKGVVLRGQVEAYIYWCDATGDRPVAEADLPTLESLSLMIDGDGPPRPADHLGYSDAWNTIHATLGWNIDTREYADGPHILTVGDPVWVQHYPDAVAGLVAGGRSISLTVVIANGERDPGSGG